jgi:arginase family enzyme
MRIITCSEHSETILKELRKYPINEDNNDIVFTVEPAAKGEISQVIENNDDKPIIIGDETVECVKGFSRQFKDAGIILFSCSPKTAILRQLAENNIISRNNIVIVGMREISKQDAFFLISNKIKTFLMKEISSEGKYEISDAVMSVARRFGAVYLSIDMDILDPAFTGSKSSPGGMTTRELIYFVQRLKRLVNLQAFEIKGTNPENAKAAAKIISEFF